MNYKAFYNSIIRLCFVYLLGLIIFQFFRIILVVNFSSWSELQNYKLDLLNAFLYMGFKFDTIVVLYMLILPFVYAIASAFVPNRFQWFHRNYLKLLFWDSFILFTLSVVLLTCDYYYYQFFQSHFNILVFGLIDDDTRAVIRSMWTDYPVIRLVLVWIVAAVLLFKGLKKIISRNINLKNVTNHWKHAVAMLIIFVLFGLGLRGSLGIFPIQLHYAYISPNTFINDVTVNGIFSLKSAFADYSRNAITTDSLATLSKYGYANSKEALVDLYGVEFEGNNFTDTTAKSDFLEQNPPHVVVCLMESMSNYYFDLNSPSLDLMGELGNQLDSSIVFRNFTSSRNNTIHSLENLLVNTPITPISKSSYSYIPLNSSVAKTYLESGYETNFITGSDLGWYNLGQFLSTQYFENVEGRALVLDRVPHAQSSFYWGAYDEFVFERVFDILKNAKKPQFIFVLLTTNHTPYELPSNYEPFPISIGDSILNALRCDVDIAMKNLTAYQYSNNSLGQLIKRIKTSELSENTVLAATGDHNSFALFRFDDSQLLMKYGVPLIMDIPDHYRPNTTDLTRFGSHKDIFPTLFNLSLSNTAYYKSGNDLFGPDSDHYYALNNYHTAFDNNGCTFIREKPLYFKWRNKKLYAVAEEESPELKSLQKHARAHSALLELDIKRQLLKNK